MGRDNCSFNYYFRGVKTAKVVITNAQVKTEVFVNEPLHLPFGWVKDENVTRRTIDEFFRRHTFPEERNNMPDILRFYGLQKFDAYALCRKTKGEMADHQYSIEWLSDDSSEV